MNPRCSLNRGYEGSEPGEREGASIGVCCEAVALLRRGRQNHLPLLQLMGSAVAFDQCDEFVKAGVVPLARPYDSDCPGNAKV